MRVNRLLFFLNSLFFSYEYAFQRSVAARQIGPHINAAFAFFLTDL